MSKPSNTLSRGRRQIRNSCSTIFLSAAYGFTTLNNIALPPRICSITMLRTGSPVPWKHIVPVTPVYASILANPLRIDSGLALLWFASP
jgi:hypothetical protein